MERSRGPELTNGYPEIWRVELYGQLLRGKSAEAKRLDYVGGSGSEDPWQNYQKTPSQIIRVYDSLRRFSGAVGDKFWVINKPDSKRWEVLSPAQGDQAPSIVRFELASTLARGGTADAYPLSWDSDTLTYVPGDLILVNDFSKSVPTSLGPGTRGLAVELTDRPGVFEIIEIERPVTETGQVLRRIELTTELYWGGTAQAKQVVWNEVTYAAAGDPFLVRDYTGHRWQGQVGYRGWALEPADRTGQWELVQLDNIAEEIEGTLIEDIPADDPETEEDVISASCAVSAYFRGMDPGTTVEVHDTHGMYTNHLTGAKFKATWNEKAEDTEGNAVGRYEFVYIQPPARNAWGKVKSSFTTSSQFATVEIVETWDGVAHDEGVEVSAENPPDYKGSGNPYIFEATITGTEYHTAYLSYDLENGQWKLVWVVC